MHHPPTDQVPCTGSNCSLRLVAHHPAATEMTLTEVCCLKLKDYILSFRIQ